MLLNLASGIISAVIILVIIDRRLRQSEIVKLQQYAIAYSVRIVSLFSRDIRTTISYSEVMLRQLQEIRPKPYLERQSLEGLPSRYPGGFILIGVAGSGKTTFVQSIAIQQLQKILRHPQAQAIPVVIPVRAWKMVDRLENCILREIFRYSRVDQKILRRWLDTNRILLILDGLDEHQQPEFALTELENFRRAYPQVVIIVTCRKLLYDSGILLRASLPVVPMPDLTDSEVERLIEV